MEKKNFIVFILSFIVLALAGLGLYAWRSAQPAPAVAQPQPTPTPTAQIPKDWKTYENTKYHYSFRYPKEYQIFEFFGIGIPRQITENADNAYITKDNNPDPIFRVWNTDLKKIDIYSIANQFGQIVNQNDLDILKINIGSQVGYKLIFKRKDRFRVSNFYYTKNLQGDILTITVLIDNPISDQIFSSLRFAG